MLVLSRKVQERILLPDLQIAIQVVAVKSGRVRLGIDAPPEVKVLREELQARATEWGVTQTQPDERAVGPDERAVGSDSRELRHFLRGQLNATGLALTLLQRQFQAGKTQPAEATLAQLAENFQLLRERLEVEEQQKLTPPAPPPRMARTALLVEDNQNERELLARLLRIAGLTVDTAGDGAAALDYLRTHRPPDAVLLDMFMPRCDGPTMIRAIRHDPALAGLKIFAVTGHSPKEFSVEIGPAGINRWFRKPINPEALVEDLNWELDRAGNSREPATVGRPVGESSHPACSLSN